MISYKAPVRKYLPKVIEQVTWETIEPYYNELLQRNIQSVDDLKKWLLDRSELESFIEEDLAWRYIRMTCDTTNTDFASAYHYFINEVQPRIAPLENQLNQKLAFSPYFDQIPGQAYRILARNVKKDIEIFREENIPLQVELQNLAHEYSTISGGLTVTINGVEKTMQQAAVHLQATDRQERAQVYELMGKQRLQVSDRLNQIFDQMVAKRHQMGLNAGFTNFRDYMFTSLGRFDYTPEQCKQFHRAVAEKIVPLKKEILEKRKQALGLEALRPYDLAVDTKGRPPLKAFEGGNDLLQKGIRCFDRVDSFLGDCLRLMVELQRFDLESRKGKAPGGYNYPLDESGVPFIFMNATSLVRDMVTFLHEGGHAVHSIVTRELELNAFKHTSAEVAELASMSMELITMDYWDEFFTNEADLKRAKREHLEQIIDTLPWVATIDHFQHEIYENPELTPAQRIDTWLKVSDLYSSHMVDWAGLEPYKEIAWHKQLHLFEVPFYYIEYGIAQLGAIAVWKNYRQNKKQGLEQYLQALKMGNTDTIPAIYEKAGIRFDFSPAYIESLMQFVKAELDALNDE